MLIFSKRINLNFLALLGLTAEVLGRLNVKGRLPSPEDRRSQPLQGRPLTGGAEAPCPASPDSTAPPVQDSSGPVAAPLA